MASNHRVYKFFGVHTPSNTRVKGELKTKSHRRTKVVEEIEQRFNISVKDFKNFTIMEMHSNGINAVRAWVTDTVDKVLYEKTENKNDSK